MDNVSGNPALAELKFKISANDAIDPFIRQVEVSFTPEHLQYEHSEDIEMELVHWLKGDHDLTVVEINDEWEIEGQRCYVRVIAEGMEVWS